MSSRKRKNDDTQRNEGEIMPAPKRLAAENGQARATVPSGGVDANRDVGMQLRPRQRRSDAIWYLPNVENLLLACDKPLDVFKKDIVAGRIDVNHKSVVLAKKSFNPLGECNYLRLLENSLISESSYEVFSQGIYAQTTRKASPVTYDNTPDPDWKASRDYLLASERSIGANHPVMMAHLSPTGEEKKSRDVWKQYLDSLGVNPQKLVRCVEELENPRRIRSLLRDGLDSAASTTDRVFEPRFKVGSALSSTPLRHGDGGLDELIVHRHGAPIYYLVFRREQTSELMLNFQNYVREVLQTDAVCSQILRHSKYMLLDEVIRDLDVPCVLFRQDAGDAVYIRSDVFWTSFSVGLNLVEARYFVSPSCYAAASARPTPCGCEDDESVAVSFDQTARNKTIALKSKSIKCRVCKVVCKTVGECERHLVAHHEIHFHLCLECDMSFPSASKLKRHEESHTGVLHECDVCGNWYRNIEIHKQVHMPHIKCGICFRTFSRRHYMAIHSKECR